MFSKAASWHLSKMQVESSSSHLTEICITANAGFQDVLTQLQGRARISYLPTRFLRMAVLPRPVPQPLSSGALAASCMPSLPTSRPLWALPVSLLRSRQHQGQSPGAASPRFLHQITPARSAHSAPAAQGALMARTVLLYLRLRFVPVKKHT